MEVEYGSDGAPFVTWGGNKIMLELDPAVDEACKEVAKKELRETPEVVEQALAELRQLLRKEPSLYVPIDRDDYLLKFLRPCKFYPESAFKKIQAYYKFRIAHADYCHDLLPSAIRSPFEHSIVSILAPRDQHGRRIVLVECGERWNPQEVSLKEVFRGIQVGLEGAMAEPATQICGVISVFDMKGLAFKHIMQFTPSYAKMVLDWIQESVPIRVKAVHIINQPYIFNMLFAIFKPFMREKLRSRIHFHGNNMNSLMQHVDPKALRKRHGGLLPDPEITGDVLWKMLRHYEEEYKLANSYGYVQNVNNNKT
ncbi:alpha-tocopherol transfer protein [Spodoptera litura]|uniref:Alpha-tocopherol transfer protein n=1 Tax=Spodoptera litura TaxID=69820 RepID=A0A9J7IMY9_SPOLT|nr:alpha-tocopherol transfer protein [Spodoptera litura]